MTAYLEEVLKNLIWENRVSRTNEGSNYFLIKQDYGIFRKGEIYRGLWASSIIHPDYYRQLTFGEFYEFICERYPELSSDSHCATCKYWTRKQEQGHENEGDCSELNTITDYCDYTNCPRYKRKFEFLKDE